MVKNGDNMFVFTEDEAKILKMACLAANNFYENFDESQYTQDNTKDEAIKYYNMYRKIDGLIYGVPTDDID